MRGIARYVLLGMVIFVILAMIIYIAPFQKTVATTTTIKAKAICGNNVCDEGESRLNCCNDCACLEGEECNAIKQRCEVEFSLSKSDAENAVRQYIGGDYEMVVGGVTQHEGRKVMLVYVYTPGTRLFAVDESGAVTEIELD